MEWDIDNICERFSGFIKAYRLIEFPIEQFIVQIYFPRDTGYAGSSG